LGAVGRIKKRGGGKVVTGAGRGTREKKKRLWGNGTGAVALLGSTERGFFSLVKEGKEEVEWKMKTSILERSPKKENFPRRRRSENHLWEVV